MNFIVQIFFALISYHFRQRFCQSTNGDECSASLKTVCPKQCRVIENHQLDLDCSPANDFKELIRQLRLAGLPIKLLKINNNPNLINLPGKSFSRLKIEKLDLSKNGLIDINPRAFDQDNQLVDLDLSFNKLTKIPDLKSFRALENLDVSQNRIPSSDVKVESFVGNPRLRFIKIDPDKMLYLQQDALLQKTESNSNIAPNLPAQPKAIAPPPNPIGSFIGASLLTDLVQNLPSLVTTLSATKNIPVTTETEKPVLENKLAAQITPKEAPSLDLARIPPEVINYIKNGGQIPGVPVELLPVLIEQHKSLVEKINVTSNPMSSAPKTISKPLGVSQISKPTKSTIVNKLPPAQVNLYEIWSKNSRAAADVQDLDEASKKTNIDDISASGVREGDSTNLYTILGLSVIGVFIVGSTVYFCWRAKKNRRIEAKRISSIDLISKAIYHYDDFSDTPARKTTFTLNLAPEVTSGAPSKKPQPVSDANRVAHIPPLLLKNDSTIDSGSETTQPLELKKSIP
uniref:Uncharacterized protein n=1 Tax=Romanomermis culicivorax TaxID=13658 RepID=A0A915K546_ROMCU